MEARPWGKVYHNPSSNGSLEITLPQPTNVRRIVVYARSDQVDTMGYCFLSIKNNNTVINSIRMKWDAMGQEYSIMNNKLVYKKLN